MVREMPKRLSCQHMETPCNYIAEADTTEDVIKKIIEHATKVHKAPREIFDKKEIKDQLLASIREPPTDTYPKTLNSLEMFINDILHLSHPQDMLRSAGYNAELLEASTTGSSAANTSNALLQLYSEIGSSTLNDIADSYVASTSAITKHVALFNKRVIAAFDYTEEDYFGALDNTLAHDWKGLGPNKKFKFLTCSVFDDSMMLPVFSIPAQVGNNAIKDINYINGQLQKNHVIGKVIFSIFGKELYNSELFEKLKELNIQYMILVPSNDKIKEQFNGTEVEGEIRLEKLFCFSDEKNIELSSSYTKFLNGVLGSEDDSYLQWCFVKNIEDAELNKMIATYSEGWQIWERPRDREYAYVKSESQDAKVQYFLFAYNQLLRAYWVMYYMEEDVEFEDYLEELHKLSSENK